jgi:hypothetical protein
LLLQKKHVDEVFVKLFFFLATLESAKLLPQQTVEPTTMSHARGTLNGCI